MNGYVLGGANAPSYFILGGVFLKQIRIRSVMNKEKSPWVYIQNTNNTAPIQSKEVKIEALATPSISRINQYGRFRYSEFQYGELIRRNQGIGVDINNTPVRIRNKNGDWVYSHQTIVEGACPAIRIRNRYGNKHGQWVYIQQKEV